MFTRVASAVAAMAAMAIGIAASAQLTTTTVASTDGCDQSAFTYVGYPHVNINGDVVFLATGCQSSDTGIWVAQNNSGTITLHQYAQISSTGSSGFQWFHDYSAINDSRVIAFKARYVVSGVSYEGLFTSDGTTTTLVASRDMAGDTFIDFDAGAESRVRINNSGKVLFGAGMSPDAEHEGVTGSLWLYTPGAGLTMVGRTTEAIDGGTLTDLLAWDFNDYGSIVIKGSYTDGTDGHGAIWRGGPTSLSRVVETTTDDWGYVTGLCVNQAGDFGVQTNGHQYSGGSPTNGQKFVWAVQPASGSRIVMAAGGDANPFDTLPFYYYCTTAHNQILNQDPPVINYVKRGLFHAYATDGGDCSTGDLYSGFWYWNGSGLFAEAYQGDDTSYWSGGSSSEWFADSGEMTNTVAINDGSQVAFIARVTDGTTPGMALFVRSAGSRCEVASAYYPDEIWFGQHTAVPLAGNDNYNSGYGRLTNCGYFVYRTANGSGTSIVLGRVGQTCTVPLIEEPGK